MGIIAWIFMGLIVGLITKMIMPGKDPKGFIRTILIGIAGAFTGGFIGSVAGFGTVDGFNFMSIALSVFGAVILLFIYRAVTKK